MECVCEMWLAHAPVARNGCRQFVISVPGAVRACMIVRRTYVSVRVFYVGLYYARYTHAPMTSRFGSERVNVDRGSSQTQLINTEHVCDLTQRKK